MRCPDCNKFVGIEMAEPEVLSLDYDMGTVSAEVRLVKTCAECGTELEEANLSLEDTPDLAEHSEEHDDALDVEEGNAENVDRTEGKGRYSKHFYGVTLSYILRCNTPGCQFTYNGELTGEEQASSFDSLV